MTVRSQHAASAALDEAIDVLVRHMAGEAGVSEQQAREAMRAGRMVLPHDERERRAQRLDLILALAGLTLLVAVYHYAFLYLAAR
jgi:hypothetical protein